MIFIVFRTWQYRYFTLNRVSICGVNATALGVKGDFVLYRPMRKELYIARQGLFGGNFSPFCGSIPTEESVIAVPSRYGQACGFELVSDRLYDLIGNYSAGIGIESNLVFRHNCVDGKLNVGSRGTADSCGFAVFRKGVNYTRRFGYGSRKCVSVVSLDYHVIDCADSSLRQVSAADNRSVVEHDIDVVWHCRAHVVAVLHADISFVEDSYVFRRRIGSHNATRQDSVEVYRQRVTRVIRHIDRCICINPFDIGTARNSNVIHRTYGMDRCPIIRKLSKLTSTDVQRSERTIRYHHRFFVNAFFYARYQNAHIVVAGKVASVDIQRFVDAYERHSVHRSRTTYSTRSVAIINIYFPIRIYTLGNGNGVSVET